MLTDRGGNNGLMLVVRATKKLLDRVGPPDLEDEEPDTLLGQWYATALFWRPRSPCSSTSRHCCPP
ncbi:hypothetical protein H4W34_003037 [Actinomadura algeriensis]|uniref:DUF6933 domain-containing protein n=1 Tax=Actinomadura algeriensis TaxID=1679523 RepID=A0ABR9JS03_9ACTN|nr:hypothetical protein [Actinomadura algeriensis]